MSPNRNGAPPQARGGKGALAPSCCATQGYDQTRENFKKKIVPTCGGRKSAKRRPATLLCDCSVASELLRDLWRPQVLVARQLRAKAPSPLRAWVGKAHRPMVSISAIMPVKIATL